MQTILVTGGAGFIGSNFIHFLQKTHPQIRIVNLDALTYAGSLENLKELPYPEQHIFVHGDICDRSLVDQIFHQYKIETVVHFAAETHVDRSISGPGQFIQTNIVGTFTLLEAARQYWLEQKQMDGKVHFHHVSTDEVFGSLKPEEPAFCETTPYAPNSPYAASKAASDHLVRAYTHTYGLPATITNCSNNYGPRQFPEKLIPLMVLNALNGQPLPVYGDGQQIRDWLYVEDHCEAIWNVITHGTPGETYAVGGENQPANLTVIRTICDILDELQPTSAYTPHEQLIQYVSDRPGHDRRYAMNILKIQQELGWQPKQSLNEGLLKTIRWYLDHPEWVQTIHQQQDFQKWMEQNYTQRPTAQEKE